MKSIKPGRGPSAMGAAGSIAVGVFGIFWTIMAASMGAPVFFVFFGLIFVGIAAMQAVYHFKNATGANRMSLYDITDADAEPDPLDPYLRQHGRRPAQQRPQSEPEPLEEEVYKFCPYCGRKVRHESYRFCPECGKEIQAREGDDFR
jgi:hypothetical protein